ncbi:WbqC family protein [Streptomyces sp. NPDC057580]|uniref:WbqC family protein n=1 Tax=Streptomyces sp. NPDC057580 TaxID=3346173 RepID=UPI003695C725
MIQTKLPSPHCLTLAQALDPVLDAFTTGKTAAVAEASTRLLLDLAGWRGQVLTSSRLPSRPGRSQRLAGLAAATGARAYLCGTGGMTYLDVAPFAAQSIAVAPFRLPTTGFWSSGRRTSALWAMATLGRQAVAACLQALAVDHQSALLARHVHRVPGALLSRGGSGVRNVCLGCHLRGWCRVNCGVRVGEWWLRSARGTDLRGGAGCLSSNGHNPVGDGRFPDLPPA